MSNFDPYLAARVAVGTTAYDHASPTKNYLTALRLVVRHKVPINCAAMAKQIEAVLNEAIDDGRLAAELANYIEVVVLDD